MSGTANLNICYLAGTLGQGGAERQLFYAVQALQHGGARVRVLSLERGGFWEQPLRDLGADVRCVGAGRSRFKRLVWLLRELSRKPADILQSQHFYTNAYVSLAGRLRRCRAIGALRSNGRFDMQTCGRLGGRINLHLPPILAGNSSCSIRYALDQGVPASRLCLLPNVVDTQRFQPSSKSCDGPITLLAAGRLTREKRFDRFLSLVYQVRHRSGLDVRGLLVGPARADQKIARELNQQGAALGLIPHAVQILGGVADMAPMFHQASICVLTSEHEGTPNVLLEAMAAGLPVVATSVGGVPDVIKDGQTGLLVANGDEQQLLAAVLGLIRAPELRKDMARRARAHVEQNHSLGQLPARLDRLYARAFRRTALSEFEPFAGSSPNANQRESETWNV